MYGQLSSNGVLRWASLNKRLDNGEVGAATSALYFILGQWHTHPRQGEEVAGITSRV